MDVRRYERIQRSRMSVISLEARPVINSRRSQCPTAPDSRVHSGPRLFGTLLLDFHVDIACISGE